MIVVTTETIPGKSFSCISLVQGMEVTVKTTMSFGYKSSCEALIQDWNTTYCAAVQRMISNAQVLGADAIVGVRFICQPATSTASVVVYGTAVKFEQPYF